MGQELHELPKGWKWQKLQGVVDILDSKRKPINNKERTNRISNKSSDDLYPYFGATGQVGIIDDYLFDEELLLLGEDGVSFYDQYKSKAYIINGKTWVNNHAHVLRAITKKSTNKFICYYLNCFDYRGFVSGSTRLKLNQGSMKSIQVPLPPLNEQKRIVAKLDSLFTRIDTAITHLQQTLELSKALFASALSKKFKLRNKNWRSVKMADVCSITSKLLDPREPEYINMLHVGGANIESLTGNLIGLKTAREGRLISGKFVFDNNVVLYSKIRPYLMKVARPNIHGLCSADIYPLTSKSGVIDRSFLFYLLLSEDFTAYAIQGSSRAGMPKVNRKHLFDYEFSIPSLEEQRLITDSLDALSELTRTLEASTQEKINDLIALKASLLDAAFKGQL